MLFGTCCPPPQQGHSMWGRGRRVAGSLLPEGSQTNICREGADAAAF